MQISRIYDNALVVEINNMNNSGAKCVLNNSIVIPK